MSVITIFEPITVSLPTVDTLERELRMDELQVHRDEGGGTLCLLRLGQTLDIRHDPDRHGDSLVCGDRVMTVTPIDLSALDGLVDQCRTGLGGAG
jgi:hypothetical protein